MTTTDEPDLIRRCTAHGCKGPEGKPRHLRDTRLVCEGCAARGHADLLGLPRRYVSLRVSLRPGITNSEKIDGLGFGSTSPVREAALNSMLDMVKWATTADTEVRTVLTMSTGKHGQGVRPAQALLNAIANLGIQWDRALHHPIGTRLVNDTLRWRIRTDNVLGWDRLVHRLPAPCPYCDTVSLIRRDGDDHVRCLRCRRAWSEAEYRHFVRMLVEEMTS